MNKIKYTLIFGLLGLACCLAYIFHIDEKGLLMALTNYLQPILPLPSSWFSGPTATELIWRNSLLLTTNIISLGILGAFIDFFRYVKAKQ